MQVKKFEGPTIQDALDLVKRELGPEAIILQTKTNKTGFGSKAKTTVEVTAAVSERSFHKKQFVETRMPEKSKQAINQLPADRQADVFDKYVDQQLDRASQTRERVEVSSNSRALTKKPASQGQGAQAPALASQGSLSQGYGRTATYAPSAHPGQGIEPTRQTSRETPQQASLAPQMNKKITATRYIDIDDAGSQSNAPAQKISSAPAPQTEPKRGELEEELKNLKKLVEELKVSRDSNAALFDQEQGGARSLLNQSSLNTSALRDAFDQLVENGLERRIALTLIKKVAFELGPEGYEKNDRVVDFLASEMMDSIRVKHPLRNVHPRRSREDGSGPAFISLVGPTGVGKTTTIAKLASEAVTKRRLKVGLINIDHQKQASFEQLATYAKVLNLPFRFASSEDDIRAAIQDLQGMDLILVDTGGKSHRDPQALNQLQDDLSLFPNVQNLLVLSASTRDTELLDICNRFNGFEPQGIVFSKLDEASIFGSIYNVHVRTKLPLVYFTTGQNVPDDLEEASSERVTSLVMEI